MAIAIHAQRSLAEACGAEISPAACAAPASDEALLLRFQTHGDEQAFRMLFSRHKDAFVSFLWRLSGRRSVAEEVSQHCWLKLIELGRGGRWRAVHGASFRTYLFTLGRNRFIDAYCRNRAESARASLSDAEADDQATADDPADLIAKSQQAARVARLLGELPSEQRDVVSLWMANFSIEQIVRLTNAPRDTVLSRKRYAFARLRRLIEAEDVSRSVTRCRSCCRISCRPR